jgi:endoribonuclease Dicer
VIEEYTDLDAVECHGASGVGEWTAEDWNEQIGSKEVSA